MSIIEDLKRAIDLEAKSIKALSNQVGADYERVIDILLNCKGKVIISGVGKSGHVGKKIAASLASTGTPAFFVHSTEGVHGDLGMIQDNDVVILISNSGETMEVLSLLPTLAKIGCKTVAITSKQASTLATNCDAAIVYHYDSEADHLGVAPTTSSTLTLVIGDAIAATLSSLKNFKKEDFHLYHPGGSLGKQLSEKGQQRK